VGEAVVRLGTRSSGRLGGDDSGVTVGDSGCQGFLPQLEPGLRMVGRSLEDVRAILLTHGDGDHLGVAARLQEEESPIPIRLNPADRYLVEKKRKKTEGPMAATLLKPGTWRLLGHFSRYGALNQPKIERTSDLGGGQELDAMASLSNWEPLEADLLLVGHGEPWTDGAAAAVDRVRAHRKR
jgi:glyoxylase-like metal-dependent hydrolase (beta-lactamase superfamily II)